MHSDVTHVTGRRCGVAVGTAAASLLSVLAAVPAAAGHHHQRAYTTNCLAPEGLVTGTTWHRHRLARGVTLSEGQRQNGRGFVDMHVLDIDVTNRHLRFAPLARRLAQRTPLTALAAGRTGLVAATNTGYFDFEQGTPLGALVDRKRPWVTSSVKSAVVGFNGAGRVQAGHLALSGSVTANNSKQPLAGLNVVEPRTGLTAYSNRWGTARMYLPRDAVSRYVANGRVTTGTGRFNTAPTGAGYLLVARGRSAADWLSGLRQNQAVAVATALKSDTAKPFTQAYGVGAQLVSKGVAATDLTCRRRYPQPARTAFGFARHGQRLLVAVVSDEPGTRMHGLDSIQTARLMRDLGANEAYLFDGSGSTELLARMPSNPSLLAMRNFPADGAERPMPVGFGIFKR